MSLVRRGSSQVILTKVTLVRTGETEEPFVAQGAGPFVLQDEPHPTSPSQVIMMKVALVRTGVTKESFVMQGPWPLAAVTSGVR